MINYRAPIIEESGAIGSLYTPYFLRQNQQKVGVDNSAAQEAWDAERAEALEKRTDELTKDMDPRLALMQAKSEIDKKYKPSDRPKDILRIPIRRLGVFPDATGPDGQALLFLYDDDGNRYPIQGGTQAYADIEAEVRGKTFDNITMATLLNDMDKRWEFTDEQLDAVRPQQPEPQPDAATQTTAPAGQFPRLTTWLADNPGKNSQDYMNAKLAAKDGR
jgi:hypothetical protein